MIATVDPGVCIEEERRGYVRYRSVAGRRWEVWGECPRYGTCQVGAAPSDVGWLQRSERLDVPVTPELRCDPCTTVPLLRFKELKPLPELVASPASEV